ncbi:hypothetical protein [Tenacibaculum sp. 190524A02b]|uniref:Uncharacterized protein n=1 Tax=Tenacibaculum vairaonense TaxID=3137860 RepID=A0ABM9PJ30_9FLAO
MKTVSLDENSFTTKTFIKAIVPAYLFPGVMAWCSGWMIKNEIVMKNSFVSIAIPSLIATVISFLILWLMQRINKFPENKFVRVGLLLVIIMSLALVTIELGNMQNYRFDILLSSLIGTVIITWKVKLKKR